MARTIRIYMHSRPSASVPTAVPSAQAEMSTHAPCRRYFELVQRTLLIASRNGRGNGAASGAIQGKSDAKQQAKIAVSVAAADTHGKGTSAASSWGPLWCVQPAMKHRRKAMLWSPTSSLRRR